MPLVATGIATRTKAAKQNDENVEDTRGDGVNTDVDSDGVELLDYDDDLSFDDEVEEIQPREMADLSKSSDQHDYRNRDKGPSTSGVMQPDSDLAAQLAMHSEDKLLNNPVIQQLLEKQLSEEKLMNNPAIQNMMESFFKNKFKDLSASQTGMSTMSKVHDKPIPGRNPLIQSPSDITIYVPALQQRLTPQINNRYNQEVEQTAQAISQVGLNAMINHGKITLFLIL